MPGARRWKQVYGETVLAAYLPFEFPSPVQRFLEHFRPRLGVLDGDRDLPNLLAGCAQNGVPVLLANARMSEKIGARVCALEGSHGPAFTVLARVVRAKRRRRRAPARARRAGRRSDREPQVRRPSRRRASRRRPRLGAALDARFCCLARRREGEEKLLLDALPAWDGKAPGGRRPAPSAAL